jgi:hypothetical protein
MDTQKSENQKPFGGLSNKHLMFLLNTVSEMKIASDRLKVKLDKINLDSIEISLSGSRNLIEKKKQDLVEEINITGEILEILGPYGELIAEAEPELAHVGKCQCEICVQNRKNGYNNDGNYNGYDSNNGAPIKPVLTPVGGGKSKRKEPTPKNDPKESDIDIDKVNF